MFLRNFFKGTAELSLDNNNRLLVPKKLMDLIGADRDVVLAGQDGRIESGPPIFMKILKCLVTNLPA